MVLRYRAAKMKRIWERKTTAVARGFFHYGRIRKAFLEGIAGRLTLNKR